MAPAIIKPHKQQYVEPKKPEKKVMNAFSALCDDSDDDSDNEDNVDVMCVDMGKDVSIATVETPEVDFELCVDVPIETVETPEAVVDKVPTQKITPVKRPTMKWHLIESSDEEDSDEE
jgi:hypothetical protein